ncbi:hypothetical protein [Floccifex sp.]|uniref:hypothetical protein n=1 Tax=Floccifex sp. TaxID=2815810 RepID=UPI003F04136C
MSKQITDQVTQLIIDQYYENRNVIRDFFDRTSMNEYVALKKISNGTNEKIYLKDLASSMQISYKYLASIISNLRDKGYVKWSFDGNGQDGTYITITEDGLHLLSTQEEYLNDFCQRAIKEFGKEKSLLLLSLIHEFQQMLLKGGNDK